MFFFRRRDSGSQAIVQDLLANNAREKMPKMLQDWNQRTNPRSLGAEWAVPAGIRGRVLGFEVEGVANAAEPASVRLTFLAGGKLLGDSVWHPVFYSGGGKDFSAFHVPRDSDRCRLEIRFGAKAKTFRLSAARIFYDEAH